MTENSTENQQDNERGKLGRQVVYFALAVIGILGFSALLVTGLSPNGELEKRLGAVKDILSILLPVIGTWVGTVLAFYFSKDNFATAAKQTSELVRQLSSDEKLKAIPAKDAWISMFDSNVVKFVLNKPESEVKLKGDILDLLTSKDKNRLPMVDSSDRVIYLIHRSIIDKFITEQAISGKLSDTKKAEDLTLEEFLGSDQYKQIATAFGTVKQDASLSDVKVQMDATPTCSDVFVTEDGTKTGMAKGWITNGILQDKSRV